MATMLVRVSRKAHNPKAPPQEGVIAHPTYGTQIQNHALPGMKPEAEVMLEWQVEEGRYPDGKPYSLRRPKLVLSEWSHGKPRKKLLTSLRVTPAIIGIGLLDAIPSADIEALAATQRESESPISGRVNTVWDQQRQVFTTGRFGWKASQPNAKQQVAAAFAGDIGITSSLFHADDCTIAQKECRAAPTGGEPEVSAEILDLVTFYAKTLAVPARRKHDNAFIKEGESLFKEAGCAGCHVETWQTGVDPEFPELSNQQIHPYSDLLLHDMGDGLADHRPDFAASGSEWRTPPLWGIGLISRVNQHTNFLHDGRARNLEEAILWHGGEAQAARDFFVHQEALDRRKMVAFLKSL